MKTSCQEVRAMMSLGQEGLDTVKGEEGNDLIYGGRTGQSRRRCR